MYKSQCYVTGVGNAIPCELAVTLGGAASREWCDYPSTHLSEGVYVVHFCHLQITGYAVQTECCLVNGFTD